MADDQIAFGGVEVSVPRGWEAEMGWLTDTPPVDSGLSPQSTAVSGPVVVHLANFALPPTRGDYGSSAVELMDTGAVFISLLEFTTPGATGRTGVFALDALPTELNGDDFSPDQLQRRLPGQAGLQRFFWAGNRRFVLYVVIGSYRSRQVLAAEASRLLRGISIG